MSLQLVEQVNYAGTSGVLQVRTFQQALNNALATEDWAKVRRLDQACGILIEKVICANDHDSPALITAIKELKGVYASLIVQCKREVASMAH